ncbi:hypothetical protein B7463_g6709, partial [Scytalidium lignicola]
MQDAVRLTNRLGIRYIWIDALCIIQGDADDWEKESLCMGDVYENSHFTIAASGATSSDQGLYAVRDPLRLFPCKLGIPRQGALYAKAVSESQLDQEPLYGRDWVLQERLFSRRTLNFGSLFVWECKTKTLDEFDPVDTIGLLNAELSVKKTFDNLHPTANENPEFIDSWNRKVVEPYTNARLTYQSDRLVAISGVIQRIERDTGWTNICGLWKPWLLEELLWGSGYFRISKARISKAIPRMRISAAPTWSWASVNTPVWRFNSYHSNNHYIIEEVPQCLDSGTGALTLRGHLFSIRRDEWDEWFERGKIVNFGEVSSPVNLFPDLDSLDDFENCSHWLLPICWTSPLPESRVREYAQVLNGIILVQSPRDATKFERIGYWGLETNDDNLATDIQTALSISTLVNISII